MIPVFAIGRAQNILMTLKDGYEKGVLNAPIYMDGMLQKINEIYDDYPEWMNNDMYAMFRESNPFDCPLFINVHNRNKILKKDTPMIIVTTAGMMSGGPVLSYFKEWAGDSKNAFLLVGYQVEGTMGRKLLEGERKFLVDDKKVFVNASIHSVNFSAHADHDGLLNYVSRLKKRPKNIFLNHGDPEKMNSLAMELGGNTVVAEPLTTYTLEAAGRVLNP